MSQEEEEGRQKPHEGDKEKGAAEEAKPAAAAAPAPAPRAVPVTGVYVAPPPLRPIRERTPRVAKRASLRLFRIEKIVRDSIVQFRR